MKQVIGILLCLNLVLSGCDRPNCNTDNLVFKESSINSKEYVLELANQLQSVDQTQVTFWIKGYEKHADAEYLNIYVQGESLCAQTRLLVEDWSTIETLRENKAKGYTGAQIENLVLELKGSALAPQFVYIEHSAILD